MSQEQEFTDFELNVDLTNTQAWDGESRPPLPIGTYPVKVVNVASKSAQKTQNSYVAVTFEVTGGDQAGGKAYNNYMIGNETGLGRLKQLMVACNTRLDKFVASDLMGAELLIDVEHEIVVPQPDANGNVGKERTFARVMRERAPEQPAPAVKPQTTKPPVQSKPAANGQTRRA